MTDNLAININEAKGFLSLLWRDNLEGNLIIGNVPAIGGKVDKLHVKFD